MNVQDQIEQYLAGQPAAKQADMRALHAAVLRLKPDAKLWFLDGTDDTGKAVTNPNIGYGAYTFKYANGTTRDFYRVGQTANKTGISVYIMGLEDKTYLARTFGRDLGKASVTGYCIKFKALKDIDLGVLEAAIRYAFDAHGG